MPTGRSLRAIYDAELRATSRRSARVIAWCALALAPLFAYLDTVIFPDHEPLFLVGRLVCMGVAALVLLALRTPGGQRHALVLAVLPPVIVGLDVDAMTMVAGRETNPYYAGVIVVLLAASLVLPWPPSWAAAVAALLGGVYAVGILASGPITHVPLFMTNVFLLFATAVLVVVGATMSERLRWREFESRMRLDAHARRQQAIATLGQLALSAVGSTRLFDCAVAMVAETLDVEFAGVLEVDTSRSRLALRAGVGWSAERCARRGDAGPGSQIAFTLGARAPIIVEDLAAERRFTPASLLVEHGVVSGVSVAIAGRDAPFGVLGAHTATRRTFTRKEVALLETVAAVLTTAILREQTEAALNEEMHTSQALARVGRELISSLETPVLIQRLCQMTAEVLGADYSNTWLWRVDEQTFTALSGYGLSPEHWEALRSVAVPLEVVAPLITRLEHEEIVPLTPASTEVPLITTLMTRHGATLAVYIAFRRGAELVGVQVAGYRERVAPFTAQETRLARGIAQLASMALTNAQLVEELERASRLKSEFVSTMSHELRTPLNVIVGYTDMLRDESSPDDRSFMLAQVRKSSLELLEMIEATLTLNRIAAGKDAPQLEMVNLGALWQELADDYAALQHGPGVVLRFEPVGCAALWTDRRKLKIVLKNLIGNALKFTPVGEVVASCRADASRCTFTVRDTGIGIPETHLPHIFEMFRQVDSSDVRSYGGAGLGLYIVQRLLSQLRGSVVVTSNAGAGSTFTVTLPLRARDGAADTAVEPADGVAPPRTAAAAG